MLILNRKVINKNNSNQLGKMANTRIEEPSDVILQGG